MSNTYGRNLRVEIFGESHGEAIGIVIDGLPSGVVLDMDKINSYMIRRKSDGNLGTKRIEADTPKILSGFYNGKTTGTPLAVIFENCNQHSGNYNHEVIVPRPSHADYTAYIKYGGNSDMRGGGHFSGRLTAPLVFAGSICIEILENMGITIGAHLYKVGSVNDALFDYVNVNAELLNKLKSKKIPCISDIAEKITSEIMVARDKGDSVGGIIECAICGAPIGIGSPFFNSMESSISSIIFSIPAIKGIEFGAGFKFAEMSGSEANDQYCYREGKVVTTTNNNAGILGGITNGMPIIFRSVVKPTPSIFIEQNSVNLKSGNNEKLSICGRHDPCIALRAVPVIEAATAIAVLDMIMDNSVIK